MNKKYLVLAIPIVILLAWVFWMILGTVNQASSQLPHW